MVTRILSPFRREVVELKQHNAVSMPNSPRQGEIGRSRANQTSLRRSAIMSSQLP